MVYNVTIKQKSYENNELKLLMVADGQFWKAERKAGQLLITKELKEKTTANN